MDEHWIPREQRVLVLARPEPDAVELVHRELPVTMPDEARLRLPTAGICGTELHIINGTVGRRPLIVHRSRAVSNAPAAGLRRRTIA
jgi:hypothetical protein